MQHGGEDGGAGVMVRQSESGREGAASRCALLMPWGWRGSRWALFNGHKHISVLLCFCNITTYLYFFSLLNLLHVEEAGSVVPERHPVDCKPAYLLA